MAFYAITYYRRSGTLPGAPSTGAYDSNVIDPDKEAFSTAPHDEEYAPVHGGEHEMNMGDGDRFNEHSYNTGYNGYSPANSSVGLGADTSYTGVASPTPQRVHFPAANYD
jgi:hypothetical protein